MAEHKEVMLRRAPLSGRWEVIRLAPNGRTITDKWPLVAEDQVVLDETFGYSEGGESE